MLRGKKLKELIDFLGKSVNQFEIEIGVERTRIEKAISRDSKISSDIISKIVGKYPNVSNDWLVTGEGNMMLDYSKADPNMKEMIRIISDAIKVQTENSIIIAEAFKKQAQANADIAAALRIDAQARLGTAQTIDRLSVAANLPKSEGINLENVDVQIDAVALDSEVLKQFVIQQIGLIRKVPSRQLHDEYDSVSHVVYNSVSEKDKSQAGN